MPSSQYHASNKLNWLRGTAFPSALSNVYLSHHTADPGTSGVNSDVSVALAGGRTTLATSNLSAPAVSAGGGFQISNTTTVTATNAAASTQTATHVGIWDAPTGGQFHLLWTALSCRVRRDGRRLQVRHRTDRYPRTLMR